jgi:hypothetical protein
MVARSAEEARASAMPVKTPAASSTSGSVAQGTATTGWNPAVATVSYITSFEPGAAKPTEMSETQLNKQLFDMTPQERIAYATKLKAAGYKVGPINGAVTKGLRQAWISAHSALDAEARAAIQAGVQSGSSANLNAFLTANAGAGGTGTGGAGVSIAKQEINDTAAAALINTLFQDLAAQKASPEEVQKYTKLLRDAQAANPVKTVYDGTGKSTTTGGIDTQQFLTQKIEGTAPVIDQRRRDAMTLMMKELGGLR